VSNITERIPNAVVTTISNKVIAGAPAEKDEFRKEKKPRFLRSSSSFVFSMGSAASRGEPLQL